MGGEPETQEDQRVALHRNRGGGGAKEGCSALVEGMYRINCVRVIFQTSQQLPLRVVAVSYAGIEHDSKTLVTLPDVSQTFKP